MKRFEKIFRGKISYKRIDQYVNLVRKTLDPDDDMAIEFDIQDDYQHIKIEKRQDYNYATAAKIAVVVLALSLLGSLT